MNELLKTLEIEEKRLYQIIENKLVKNIFGYCQWELHCHLKDIIREKEVKIIKKEIETYVRAKLKALTPLHYQNLDINNHMDIFDGIYRPTYLEAQYRLDIHEMNMDYKKNGWAWAEISYAELEKEGFSRDFAKRILEKLIHAKILKRKRAMPGFSYGLANPECIKTRIQYAKKGFEMIENGFKHVEQEDWIYKEFKDDYLKEKFQYFVDRLFEKMDEM